jgi:hypothetical protein
MLEEDDTSFSLFAPLHFSPEAACTAKTEETETVQRESSATGVQGGRR